MPRRRSNGAGKDGVPVEATVHRGAKRSNIPTSELGGFVADQENRPKPVLYPRDPSLDPQLVWRGKDEQDAQPLEVPAVPIYIQEKIAPRVVIEDLRSQTRREADQPDLFSHFNGIAFEELVEFYQHKQNWSNRMILGDSLLAMTSLAEKEGLKGQVQCIYIDPPYGIKFGSNWQVSTRKRDVRDGRDEDATRQPEQVKAFRDTWELGIHSYLAYLRDRLTVARGLLSDTGSVFIQIGDDHCHLVRSVLDEVFGSENWLGQIAFVKTGTSDTDTLSSTHDYLLWYAKEKSVVKTRKLWTARRERTEGGTYTWAELPDGSCRRLTAAEVAGGLELPPGSKRFRAADLSSQGEYAGGSEQVVFSGRAYSPSPGRHWNKATVERLILANRVSANGRTLAYKRMADDFTVMGYGSVWDDTVLGTFAYKWFVVQTGVRAVERCILMTTDPGDLVLDPTCGSGTTAYVAEQWGRRWITIDTSRVALTLARTRLMSARYPYYILADSPQGARLLAEQRGQPALATAQTTNDVSRGFVYRTVPHVTLKSIANNPDIHEGMTREEIDAAIGRHAESETLYDQPFEDRKVVRVTGPFTVESLSPHRVVAPDPDEGIVPPSVDEVQNDVRFRQQIVDNLRIAGVQNTVRNERLTFSTLDPWPGTYIQAAGDYDASGTTRRAAVAIGPEHGTVDADFVRQAAKEASRNLFDILVICGYAFDARVGEEARQLGRLTVLKAAINPDLQFGGDLLKKSGAANLFTVFGEPDIELRSEAGGLVVEIHGIDVYDPTTGEVRSNSADDIACWFIDTDYNEESFFVRHAYFTGGNEPYAQLKRALRAEVDEDAWASLYRTVSRPFSSPSTGRIAIKVINHYGDEVMKVYETAAVAAPAKTYARDKSVELLAADEPEG